MIEFLLVRKTNGENIFSSKMPHFHFFKNNSCFFFNDMAETSHLLNLSTSILSAHAFLGGDIIETSYGVVSKD